MLALELADSILDVIPQFMTRIRAEVLAASPDDLSIAQYRILGDVLSGRELAGEIAKERCVSQAAMSKMIEVMVGKGLLRRRKLSKDRRQTPLQATAKGEALYRRIRKTVQHRLGDKAFQLRAQSLTEMMRGLVQLEKLLSTEINRPTMPF